MPLFLLTPQVFVLQYPHRLYAAGCSLAGETQAPARKGAAEEHGPGLSPQPPGLHRQQLQPEGQDILSWTTETGFGAGTLSDTVLHPR